jgi:conjugative transfer signal peptidase TraF
MAHRVRNYRKRNYITPPVAVAVGAALAICAIAFSNSTPRHALFVWNASASAPVGLYRVIHQRDVLRGDLVLAIPNHSVAIFAAEREYLPMGVPLVKRVVAVEGDTVCARGNGIFFNRIRLATRLSADNKGRTLPSWTGCRTLGRRDVFLLMAGVSDSFDGRYFGPTDTSNIVGRLEPIWTR